jgi:hypothetical protein
VPRFLLRLTLGLLLAAAPACSDVAYPPYTPISAKADATGALYTLGMGPLTMVIDASMGARITEFSLNGTNVLTGPAVDPENYGGTFWPSPQSSWCSSGGGCWPPIGVLDVGGYGGSVDPSAHVITLNSGSTTISGYPGSLVSVTKQLTPVRESGAIDVTYTLSNAANSVPISVAPWQVSRVQATGGLTFFASPDGSVTYAAGSDPAFAFADDGGDLWYDFSPVTADSKALADGSGWLAHVTAGGLLILLQFPDIQPTAAAPGEAEIEVYTGPNADYLEMEAQGPYVTLGPSEALTWTVRWKLRQVPGGTSVAAGSAGLAALAKATLAE